jgi:phage-related tail fiber protein
MIDQSSQFFAILTNIGIAKQANADALGIPWKITQMGVGDANGTDPIPAATQTRLIKERRRAPLNQLKVDPANAAIIVAEQVIPENVGGWWIREIGLYDEDGDLIAIANCAPSFKPLLTQGSGRTQVVRMNMIVSNSSNVELKIDPSVVLATRAYVDTKVLEELNKLDSKQSVRAATTATVTLTGLKTVDGVALAAGDRVLVKNQTAAKENGLYVVATGAWSRARDAASNATVTSAMLVSVEQGTTQADTRWQLVTDGAIALGTTALTFQNITQGLAPIKSPAFQGEPTAPEIPRFDASARIVSAKAMHKRGHQYSNFTHFSGALAGSLDHIGGVVH